MAYDFDEYRSMFEKSGFTQIVDIDQGPIRAVKPWAENLPAWQGRRQASPPL
jgi:hypothetical protein